MSLNATSNLSLVHFGFILESNYWNAPRASIFFQMQQQNVSWVKVGEYLELHKPN